MRVVITLTHLKQNNAIIILSWAENAPQKMGEGGLGFRDKSHKPVGGLGACSLRKIRNFQLSGSVSEARLQKYSLRVALLAVVLRLLLLINIHI